MVEGVKNGTLNNSIVFQYPLYKILLLGESNVGKTSLKIRFVDDSFPIDYKPTIGVDYKIKCVHVENEEIVKLSIWDTAGQERYRSIAKAYLNNAQGVILCFDISDRNSFNELKYWVNFVQDHIGKSVSSSKGEVFKMVLVGTKLDKQNFRKVPIIEAKKLADDLNIPYFETSAMKNLNIDEVFKSIAKNINKEFKIKENNKSQEFRKTSTNLEFLTVQTEGEKKSKNCC